MSGFIAYLIIGVYSGAAYAIAASGLVLTYTTTKVFNIAHGAFGMLGAFAFWDFSVRQGMPVLLALALVLGVVSPAIGWILSRYVARDLGDSPVTVSLVVTVGLMVTCIGLASQIWPPEVRVVPPFFNGSGITVFGLYVTAHQIVTILISGLVALGLYGLLNRTRVGIAMRAAVDNPHLLKLFGGKPSTVAALSWSLGISLASLGGILLASTVGLDYYELTLLVVNAYAAAMLGKLKNLPMTFVGAMALGVLQSLAVGYLPSDGFLSGLRAVVPALFLFVVVIGMPSTSLRIGQVKGLVSAPMPSNRKAVGWGAALIASMFLYASGADNSDRLVIGTAICYAIVMLSLVLLTGYGGHVSLAQFSFAGVGALAYIKVDQPSLIGLVLAAAAAAGVGAVVALPVLRLTGLYLALATVAFGVLMDKLVFQADFAFGYGGVLAAAKPSILGFSVASGAAYTTVLAAFFVAVALGMLMLRRGVLGRILIAMRDSPAACNTLGLDMRWLRVGLFALSAGVAGLAGALFAGLRETAGPADFQFFGSLPLLLFAVVCGVTSITGAALGGLGLAMLPVLQSDNPAIAGLLFAALGAGAVALGRDPNGLANLLFKVSGSLARKAFAAAAPARPGARHVAAEVDTAPVTAELTRKTPAPMSPQDRPRPKPTPIHAEAPSTGVPAHVIS